jgi:two-component system, OmpR family, response regulator ChvI
MNRILVVDDERDINMIILEDIGFKVDVYEDLRKALSNFSPGHYDLVILDIVMPTMNGFMFYKRIKEIDTKIKVCFLTASETTQKEFEKGICPLVVMEEVLIRKPIRNEDLLEKVKRILMNSNNDPILSQNQWVSTTEDVGLTDYNEVDYLTIG